MRSLFVGKHHENPMDSSDSDYSCNVESSVPVGITNRLSISPGLFGQIAAHLHQGRDRAVTETGRQVTAGDYTANRPTLRPAPGKSNRILPQGSAYRLPCSYPLPLPRPGHIRRYSSAPVVGGSRSRLNPGWP